MHKTWFLPIVSALDYPHQMVWLHYSCMDAADFNLEVVG